MRIALLGTGLMGQAVTQRFLQTGRSPVVYNRTASKAMALKKSGALIARTPGEAVASSDVILLFLTDAKAIDDVLFYTRGKFLKNKTVIQMGTIAPRESLDLQQKVAGSGGTYLECPVLGSRAEAHAGKLILMVGSARRDFRQWRDFLTLIGRDPYFIGPVGKAAALKLALNHLIAAHACTISLSLGLVQKNKIDVDLFMGILRKSSLYAPMFDKKLSSWLKRDYRNANFPAKHLLKDVNLILGLAKSVHLKTDGIEAIRRLLKKTVGSGLGDQDYASVFNVINKVK